MELYEDVYILLKQMLDNEIKECECASKIMTRLKRERKKRLYEEEQRRWLDA